MKQKWALVTKRRRRCLGSRLLSKFSHYNCLLEKRWSLNYLLNMCLWHISYYTRRWGVHTLEYSRVSSHTREVEFDSQHSQTLHLRSLVLQALSIQQIGRSLTPDNITKRIESIRTFVDRCHISPLVVPPTSPASSTIQPGKCGHTRPELKIECSWSSRDGSLW